MVDDDASSGRATLVAIDDALAKVRRDADALDAGFQRARAKVAETRQAQLALLARVARIRMQELERGDLAEALDDTDRRVTGILAARAAAQESLAAEIASAEEKLAGLERERGQQQAAVDAAAEAVDDAEADAQRRLDDDSAYQATLAAARDSDAVADQAETKAEAAEADRIEKSKPYEADPVFRYLWAKGFGTARYRASPPVRLLDRWVARNGGFEDLRRNYSLLTEIPRRLEGHAARMREVAARDLEAARAIEQRVADAAGVPARKDVLDEAERRLMDIDRAIDEQESALDTLAERRAVFANGEDEFSVECTALLSDAFRREGLDLLRERAAGTKSPEDDALIDEIADVEDLIEGLTEELIQYRRLHQAQRERTLALEDVRRRFKLSRYDDVHSVFVNGALIALLLERFLGGSADADEVWKAIRRQQRFRRIGADPRFGTGRFPHAPFPPPWRMPGGGGGWNFPKGGGFGGGGFGRGGGFGGGGFGTGGGF
ncbi:MAG: hypothetical protein JXB36_18840 [Gammaproteobacteria bacterium]|nr:hypothetical protein [Gammaproteobacteria bacterium]